MVKRELLGVKLDHKNSFDDYISELCKKLSRKIHALSRVALDTLRCLMNEGDAY